LELSVLQTAEGWYIDDILAVSENEVYFISQTGATTKCYIFKYDGSNFTLITGNLNAAAPYSGRCNLARRSTTGEIYTIYNGVSWSLKDITSLGTLKDIAAGLCSDDNGNMYFRAAWLNNPTNREIFKGFNDSFTSAYIPLTDEYNNTHFNPPYNIMDSVGNNIYHITSKVEYTNSYNIW
jgi:hypothetical protein